jgi:anti-sigma factor RsiW
MDCDANKQLLHAYLDGELEFARRLEVESHLNDCQSCNRMAETILAETADDFRHLVRMNIPTYKAPPDLKASVRAALQKETQSEILWIRRFRRPLLYAAAVLVVSLISVFAWLGIYGDKDQGLVAQAISNHAHSLLLDHAVDVASSDQHTIRPWLAEKLDYSPPVADLADSGYKLIGGRIDMLEKRPIAAVVYQHEDHIINVFVWPAIHGAIDFEDQYHQGYLVCGWNKSGLNYIVVAALSREDMEKFEDELRERTK